MMSTPCLLGAVEARPRPFTAAGIESEFSEPVIINRPRALLGSIARKYACAMRTAAKKLTANRRSNSAPSGSFLSFLLFPIPAFEHTRSSRPRHANAWFTSSPGAFGFARSTATARAFWPISAAAASMPSFSSRRWLRWCSPVWPVWTGALPSDLGFGHFDDALSGENLASLSVSLQTAFVAGPDRAGARRLGGARRAGSAGLAEPGHRRGVPPADRGASVAIGLGLLIAFNSQPLLLGGTRWIVILAHAVLVLAFAFSAVSAALDRLDPAYRQAAESLGAGPVRVLVRVTLPLLLPAFGAAAGLAVALSMGELGATVMVYPATWKTLPVTHLRADRPRAGVPGGRLYDDPAAGDAPGAGRLGRIRGRAALR